LFWLVEVRAGNVAHRPISHPRPAIGFVGSRRVFFPVGHAERSLRARSRERGCA
jgi:hypothetical protein